MAENLREAIEEILPEVAADAMRFFQKAIADKKLVFSEELMRDFELNIIKEAESVSAEIRFQAYGRFKDMKSLRWAGAMPNLDALEKWIETIGVQNFAWIPGYENTGHVPADNIAIRRLRNTIAHAIHSVPITEKKYSGTWYNETKMRMLNVARRRILDSAAKLIADHVVDGLENK